MNNKTTLLFSGLLILTSLTSSFAETTKADTRETIIISDMTIATPPEALSKTRKKNHWQLIDYIATSLNGTMLGAASLLDAPDVTLPLGLKGWYAIHIGFWNPHHAYDSDFKLKLKLTGDACFQNISDPEPKMNWKQSVLKEAFFKYADLSKKNLIIGQHTKGTPQKAYIAYVKLVPLSEQQVKAIKTDRARKDTRKLYALNDGNGLFYKGPTTREDLLEEIEQYRHSDVGTVLFAATSGGIVNYPSKIGMPWHAGTGDSIATPGHKTVRDSLKSLLDQNIVPMQVLLESCHQMDIDFHAMFRLGIIGDVPPSDLWENSKSLVCRKPELRLVDKDGTAVEKASYAYPEVRQYMLSLIREVAQNYDIDGVNLCFIRGMQFVGYEDIVIKDFKAKYGIDPRELDENDIRAQRHRATYLTEFVRSARKLVDEIGAAKGKKIELSAGVLNGEVDLNLFFGWDIMTWLNEGHLDSMFIGGDIDPAALDAVKANNCKLIRQLYPRGLGNPFDRAGAPEAAQALQYFETGTDGVWYWDMNFVQEKPEYWDVLRRIAHKEEIKKFAELKPPPKTIQLKTVAGCDIWHLTNKGSEEKGYGIPAMLHIYSGG